MGRHTEAMAIAIFAALIAAPTVGVFVWFVIGPQSSGIHVQLVLILALAATVSAYVAAHLLLARSGIETYGDGFKLGLWSAFGFYLGWLVIFALIPALVGAPEGWLAFAAFILRAAGHVLVSSGGLPLFAGVLGGLLYVMLKRRIMRGAHG